MRAILFSLFPAMAMAQSAGTFIATGNLTTPRYGHTATLLTDGRVLIAGGYTDEHDAPPPFSDAVTATAELYDATNGKFTVTGNMTSGRSFHTATLLADGRVLIAGGRASGGSRSDSLASAELYDPSTGTFSATGSMNRPLSNHTATLLPDSRVLIPWGAFADIYDPDVGTFTTMGNPSLPYDSYDRAWGTLLMNGKVLFVGGNNDPGPHNRAELYDPSTGIFTDTGNMTAARAKHTVTLLPDGQALIAGGSTWISSPQLQTDMFHVCCLARAELYDPSTGTFSGTGNMTTPRRYHTATLLPDGRILIAGGSTTLREFWEYVRENPTGVLAAAELYRPAALIPAPVLFSLSGDGRGQGAILHASTHRVASLSSPANVGEALEIYLTGIGDGSSVIPPQVAFDGRMAEVLFFGNAPGLPDVNQVNVRVPRGVTPGPAVAVRLNYLGRPSNEVTIGVH